MPATSEFIGLSANSSAQRRGVSSDARPPGWGTCADEHIGQPDAGMGALHPAGGGEAARDTHIPGTDLGSPDSQFFCPGLMPRSWRSTPLTTGTSGSSRNTSSVTCRAVALPTALAIGCFGVSVGSSCRSLHHAQNAPTTGRVLLRRASRRTPGGSPSISSSMAVIGAISANASAASCGWLANCSSNLRRVCVQQFCCFTISWRMAT